MINNIVIVKDFDALGTAVQKAAPSKRALIITHAGIKSRYGSAVKKSLSKAGIRSEFHIIPQGEKAKSLGLKPLQACSIVNIGFSPEAM